MYWDVNNLYGYAMSQTLPYGEFDWLTKKEINEFSLDSISENSPIGYIKKLILNTVINYMIFIMIIH